MGWLTTSMEVTANVAYHHVRSELRLNNRSSDANQVQDDLADGRAERGLSQEDHEALAGMSDEEIAREIPELDNYQREILLLDSEFIREKWPDVKSVVRNNEELESKYGMDDPSLHLKSEQGNPVCRHHDTPVVEEQYSYVSESRGRSETIEDKGGMELSSGKRAKMAREGSESETATAGRTETRKGTISVCMGDRNSCPTSVKGFHDEANEQLMVLRSQDRSSDIWVQAGNTQNESAATEVDTHSAITAPLYDQLDTIDPQDESSVNRHNALDNRIAAIGAGYTRIEDGVTQLEKDTSLHAEQSEETAGAATEQQQLLDQLETMDPQDEDSETKIDQLKESITSFNPQSPGADDHLDLYAEQVADLESNDDIRIDQSEDTAEETELQQLETRLDEIDAQDEEITQRRDSLQDDIELLRQRRELTAEKIAELDPNRDATKQSADTEAASQSEAPEASEETADRTETDTTEDTDQTTSIKETAETDEGNQVEERADSTPTDGDSDSTADTSTDGQADQSETASTDTTEQNQGLWGRVRSRAAGVRNRIAGVVSSDTQPTESAHATNGSSTRTRNRDQVRQQGLDYDEGVNEQKRRRSEMDRSQRNTNTKDDEKDFDASGSSV